MRCIRAENIRREMLMKLMKKYAKVFLGAVLCGLASGLFLMRMKLIGGGFAGIANILYNTLGIAPALVITLMNIFASIIAWRGLDWKFLVYTFITGEIYSLSIQFFLTFPSVTDDLLASCILGGVISGIGTVLIMSENSSRGGTDIIARYLQKIKPWLPIGKILLVMDGLVIVLGFCVYKDSQRALFGILVLLIETSVVDLIIRRLNTCSMLMIVTERDGEVRASLKNAGTHGMTVLEGTGDYTGRRKGVIMVAVKSREVPDFYNAVHSADNKAFIINLHSNEVNGEGFEIYR